MNWGLRCDEPGCTTFERFPDTTEDTVREAARLAGWTGNGTALFPDRCPEHAAQGERALRAGWGV